MWFITENIKQIMTLMAHLDMATIIVFMVVFLKYRKIQINNKDGFLKYASGKKLRPNKCVTKDKLKLAKARTWSELGNILHCQNCSCSGFI